MWAQSAQSMTNPIFGQDVEAHWLASSTKNLELGRRVRVISPINPQVGDIVAVRALTESETYNRLELRDGDTARLRRGDIFVGVLGRRKALKGFVGDVPSSLAIGDHLHLLNQGGVIGLCSGHFHELGEPIELELLGTVVQGDRVLNLRDHALPSIPSLPNCAPLVIIAGTCMQSGKTQAAASLIQGLSAKGYRVAGAKLSGVACLRDTLKMETQGAFHTLSFLDCGHPSTVGVTDLPQVARDIVGHLSTQKPDLIVMELGDGLLGGYRVEAIFDDADLMQHCAAVVFCANDFVGAWGGIHLLQKKGVTIDVIAGSATDSPMGVEYIEQEFGVAGANALTQAETLVKIVEEKVKISLDKAA
ncbi:MAG: hypothetical protein H6728_10325 [Myxococcales bacterium]|nr:hypothetical protein [Myxococcales bacterium]MCB9643455.1 hypothetical protein [Myxococcales bacterium]